MWKQFKHKTVRDLAWCITSEKLLNDELAISDEMLREDYKLFEKKLLELDKNPQPLVDFLSTKNTRRLGHYFEQLIFYWLEHSKRFDIVANNMPVRTTKGQTLGEIDLIVFDQEQALHEHWELAVKFYLADTSDGETLFIGPNANDYLHLKLQKLKEHQCKILECSEGQKILRDLEISYIQSKLLIKGILYYHPKQTYIPWLKLNPNHAKSWWIYLNEATDFLNNEHEFAFLHKDEWLSTASNPKTLMNKEKCLEKLKQELNLSARSIYLCIYKNGVQVTEGFVVRDTWPKI